MNNMPQQTLEYARQVLSLERNGLNALLDAMNQSDDNSLALAFCEAVELCLSLRRNQTGRIIVIGIGKSGHIGRKIAATLASTGTRSVFVHASEASHGDLGMIDTSDIVLALSNSGETRELSDAMQYCARFSIPLIAITSGDKSALAKAADIVLLLPNVPEACANTRAPTTSTTMSLALGDALAVTLLQHDGFGESDFKVFHPGGKLGAAFRKVRDIASGNHTLPLIDETASMQAAVSQITEGGLGIVGICDASGLLKGVITDGDIRRSFQRDLVNKTAGDVMSQDPITVAPDQMAADALGLLNRRKIQAAFIVDEGRPIGVLHLHDFLKEGVL